MIQKLIFHDCLNVLIIFSEKVTSDRLSFDPLQLPRSDLTNQHSNCSNRTADLAPRIRSRCPHRRDLDFAFDQLLPIYGLMQIPHAKDTPAKGSGYFARYKRKKVTDSGQVIKEATAESSDKIAVIEQLLMELP
jgi:hypothetical protein